MNALKSGLGALAAITGLVVACAGSDGNGTGGAGPEPDGGLGSTSSSSGATSGSSSTSSGSSAQGDSGVDSSAPSTDVDKDGLDDALEDAWAKSYLPFLSIHPSDTCTTHGILVRVAPHPSEAGRVMMWVDVLWDKDCGANGHDGDDEMFGVVIDPKIPAPEGILAVRAISHQNTPCQSITTCGRCPGMTACSTGTKNGKDYPVVFPSKDKHGNYVSKTTCSNSIVCDFGGCSLASAPPASPIVNAGEPNAPRVTDLTDQGFVTTANGWKSAGLMHFNPWKAGNFGGAGDVSKDLVDAAFVVDTTSCK
jgi:hypothetical protein